MMMIEKGSVLDKALSSIERLKEIDSSMSSEDCAKIIADSFCASALTGPPLAVVVSQVFLYTVTQMRLCDEGTAQWRAHNAYLSMLRPVIENGGDGAAQDGQ